VGVDLFERVCSDLDLACLLMFLLLVLVLLLAGWFPAFAKYVATLSAPCPP